MNKLYLQKGFTLAEVVVVATINTVLMLAVSLTVMYIYQQNSYTFSQSQEIDHARRGLLTWEQDARSMSTGADGSYAVEKAQSSSFEFYTNIDHDKDIEFVRYVVDDHTLYRYIYKATGLPVKYERATPTSIEILSEYVQNIDLGVPLFTYYGGNGAELLSPEAMITDIRYVDMEIVINVDPLRSPDGYTLKGSVTPRNLKDNL